MAAGSPPNTLTPSSPPPPDADSKRAAWAQVVSASPSPPPSPLPAVDQAVLSDSPGSGEASAGNSDGNQSNAGNLKKPAWNKPLNGVIAGVGPLMGGAVSWPALSESTRAPSKSTSDSSKPVSDPSLSTSQGPVISSSPQNQKHVDANPNPSSSPSQTMPVRQRSGKRGGPAGVGSAVGGFSRAPPPPPPPPYALFEMPYGALVPALPDSSLVEHPYKGNSWEGRPIGGFVSHSHPVNDQSSQRNFSRRSNFGGRHSTHGSRRDQDRDRNGSRSSNPRDVHLPQHVAPHRGFIGPPPGSTPPFIVPQFGRPFGNPMGFDMTSPFMYVPPLPPDSFRAVPFIHTAPAPPPPPPPPPTPPPMFYPYVDASATLSTLLVNQIDYYFSDDNLVKDDFLRSKMDDEGWVPIDLISGFPRVQQMTNDIQVILDSLRASSVVEVQGNKVRRRNEWRKWIPASGRLPIDSGSQSPVGLTSNLIKSFQKVSLDEANANQDSATTVLGASQSSSEELNRCSKLANGACTNEEAPSQI